MRAGSSRRPRSSIAAPSTKCTRRPRRANGRRLNDLRQRLRLVVDEILRPSRQIRYGGQVDVDAKVMVKRREKLIERDGSRGSLAGMAIGGADYLPRLHAA